MTAEERPFSAADQYFMEQALIEANKALAAGEVPVGAVIVHEGEIIARGHNYRETGKDATLHAEMTAIREACRVRGGWRLPGSVIYVTLEPCMMCAGALVQARLKELVFAAPDPKAGAAGSVLDLVRFPGANHCLKVRSGLKEAESAAILQQFFQAKRREQAEK